MKPTRALLAILVLLIDQSCSSPTQSNTELNPEVLHAARDYISYFDTSKFRSEDFFSNHYILKALVENDTGLIDLVENNLPGHTFSDSGIHNQYKQIDHPNILDHQEAYEFTLRRSFSDYVLIITVLKQEEQCSLVYSQVFKDSLGLQRRLELNIQIWDHLEEKVNGTDFWQMFAHEGQPGFDGSWWTLSGIRSMNDRDITSGLGKPMDFHFVSRWSPNNSCFKAVGYYLMELTGEDWGKIY